MVPYIDPIQGLSFALQTLHLQKDSLPQTHRSSMGSMIEPKEEEKLFNKYYFDRFI